MGYITIAEIANASVPNPSAGKEQFFFDTSDSQPKWKNSAGTVTSLVPNNTAYQTIFRADGRFADAAAGGTYMLRNSGTTLVTSTTAIATPGYVPTFQFRTADYTATGMTQKLRVLMQIATNSVSVGTVTFTAGLYPVTVAGAASNITYTLGTVTPNSNLNPIVNPGTSTFTNQDSGDFTIPADGAYTLGVVTSGAQTTTAVPIVNVWLQIRNV
jgi:hypothetical protein